MWALSLCCLLIPRQAACPDVGAQKIPHLSSELPCCRCCGLLTTGQGVEEWLYEWLQVGLECLHKQTSSNFRFRPCSCTQLGHTSIKSTGQQVSDWICDETLSSESDSKSLFYQIIQRFQRVYQRSCVCPQFQYRQLLLFGVVAYSLAQDLHDCAQLLPDGFLQVACLGEVVQARNASQGGQEWHSLLWHNLDKLAQ